MSGLFLRLFGEKDIGGGRSQRIAFEARLGKDGKISTVICNRDTGQPETSGAGIKYYRISLFDPATESILTTFDLLLGEEPVKQTDPKTLLLDGLRVRCLLAPFVTDVNALVTFQGRIVVVEDGGRPTPAFRGLEAVYQVINSSQRQIQKIGTGDFLLTKLGDPSHTAEFLPQGDSNLFKEAMGVDGRAVLTFRLQVSFQPAGAEDRQAVLTFFSVLQVENATSEVSFRRHRVTVRGESQWSFVQRAPAANRSRELEGRANRWIVLADSGAGATAQNLLELWNQFVADPVLQALRLVQAGRQISSMPLFSPVSIPARFVYEALEPDPQDRNLKPSQFAFKDAGQGSGKIEVRMLSLQSGRESKVKADSTLPGLRTLTGEALTIPWRIVPAIPANKAPETAREGLVIGAIHLGKPSDTEIAGEQAVRIGSLEITFPPKTAAELPATKDEDPRSLFAAEILPPAAGALPALPFIDLEVSLAAATVAPGGQDGLPEDQFVQSLPEDFQRQPPVIVPLGDPERRELALSLEEKTTSDRSQTLNMLLFDRGKETAGATGRSVVVIDRQPFLVAKVNVPPFQGTAEASEIANWSGGSPSGASWELKVGSGVAQGFVLDLPAQGVGEAMEKVKGPEDIDEGKPADFRFTPPAHFELQASFFKQRFAEAPWNLRRILGVPGDRAPGAGIEKMDFEMLYGLGCEVDTPFLRLAEIAARLGAIPGDVPKTLPWPATKKQEEERGAFRAAWADTFGRYFSRLAVLEPWDDHQPLELTLDDGVRYELRKNAHLRYPILKESLPKELEGKIPAEPPSQGLAGGVAWGFESANVYHATWRDPKSTSGKLSRPYFSALGGWGFQKASFDNDRTTIYADTAMGRTFFLSLERIGRIGTLWNVAKHVIIYERTVAPTKQFADKQDHHASRPLLRKVREFVEILQPTRSYPEFGAPPATRGFVVGSEFKSRIINVDSAWGQDVGTIGWKVPLWRPDEAIRKKDVYPKPQILLQVAADPEGGSPTVPVEIDEPEKLFFYTDTRKETDARTDLWPAVEGIDYVDRPAPQAPKIPGHAKGDLDRPLPDAPAIEPGFDRFTWAVLPAERGANLVVDRAEGPLAALIRNVTMMRAQPRSAVTLPANLKEALDLLATLSDPVENVFQELLARVPTGGAISKEAIERLKTEIGLSPAGQLLNNLHGTLKTLEANPAIKALLTGKNAICDELKKAATGALTAFADRVKALGEELRKNLVADLLAIAGSHESLRIEAHRILAEEVDKLRQIARGIEAGLTLVSQQAQTLGDEIEGLQKRVDAEIGDVQAWADSLHDKTRQEMERLRGRIREMRGKILAFLGEVDSRLAAVTEPRLAGAAQKLRAALREGRLKAEILLDKAEGLLNSDDPEKALEDVKGKLTEVKTALDTALKGALDAVVEGQNAVKALFNIVAEIQETIHKAEQKAGDAIDTFFDTHQQITDELAIKIDEALTAELAAITGHLNEFKVRIEEALGKVCDQLLDGLDKLMTEVLDRLDSSGKKILDAIRSRLDELITQIGNGIPVTAEALRRAVENALAELRQEMAPLASYLEDGIREAAKKVAGAISQLGDNVLRLLRAFGDAPIVPNLGFNRRQIAYFFPDLGAIDITPVTALINRIGEELKALGIRIPTVKLLDRILPASLENFDLSKIFPDFSGLKLDNLFPGLRMPKIANDTVKVTQGIDPETRRAWMQADVDVPIDQPSDLFVTGPVTVRLLRARFRAQARIEAGLDGSPRQTVRGEIRGDWQISVAGTAIVLFRDTALIFEDGRVRFDLSADKVEFTAALRFLADLIKKVGYSEGGFSVRLLEEGGLPAGVESVLDLPLPDIAAGAFSITSLRLGSTFALRINPLTFDFSLSTRFHLGTKEAPFALAISILTGGGWLDARALYTPRTGAVDTSVSVGIVAGGSLAFNFGPIHGGVYIFFGIEAEFVSKGGSGQTLNVAILLLVRGEVQVLGFLSVGLHLLLQAQYQQSGRLIGTGTLSISIKVCRFFTVSVSTSVRYEFAKGSGGGGQTLAAAAEAEDPFQKAAAAYIGMLE